jgi:hypothetical protein
MYYRGHIPDHPEVVKKRLGLHLHPDYARMRATALPLQTTNRAKLPVSAGGPGGQNQGDASDCEGFAHSSGATLRLAIAGTPLPEVISGVGLYYGALLADRSPNPDGTLPPIFDNGTGPSSIISGWGRWGAAGRSAWGQVPSGSATMYQNPSDPNSALINPTPEQLYSEFPCKFGGAFFIQTSGLQKVIDILSALAAGYPVSDAIPASGGVFQSYSGGILTAEQMTGPIDHANLITDYAWTGSLAQFNAWLGGEAGLDAYLVGHGVNSWGGVGCVDGGSWGEVDPLNGLGGQYRFDRSFFDMLQSPCVLAVTRSS